MQEEASFADFLDEHGAEILDRTFSIAGGASQVALGIGICTGGATCVAGGVLAVHGASNFYEGVSGSDSLLRDGYRALLGDAGDWVYTGVDVASSGYGMLRQVVKPGSWKLFRHTSDQYMSAWRSMTGTEVATELGGALSEINSTKRKKGDCDK